MEAAKRSRLRLSRRRPPSGVRSPSNPPGSPPDGGECARPWAELLRAAYAELNVDGEPPPLPAFPGQEPRRSPERAPPESFIVGTETFSWTPFPPAPRRGGDPSDCDRVLREALGRTGSSAWSPQRHPAPEPRGTSSAEEQPSVEGLPTLQSCPMCQAVFAPRLLGRHDRILQRDGNTVTRRAPRRSFRRLVSHLLCNTHCNTRITQLLHHRTEHGRTSTEATCESTGRGDRSAPRAASFPAGALKARVFTQ
ncbi:Fanconi anemia core complex-associated protein 20 isoform X2 [Sagmatias obliquidens]|uniref:Fanconi anemia core complex-associated protein 20 isoform X2 n=1 Tax=Sagmatias obliquidens TaxID=3371155 RepID=UPI000F4407F7|nr:Fanconi anemia core complex-associated protein 20 isoform X2 [Lagenorhynchus obliquidens]